MTVARRLEMRDERCDIHIPVSVGSYAKAHDGRLTLWGQEVSKIAGASNNSSRGFNDPRQVLMLCPLFLGLSSGIC